MSKPDQKIIVKRRILASMGLRARLIETSEGSVNRALAEAAERRWQRRYGLEERQDA